MGDGRRDDAGLALFLPLVGETLRSGELVLPNELDGLLPLPCDLFELFHLLALFGMVGLACKSASGRAELDGDEVGSKVWVGEEVDRVGVGDEKRGEVEVE